MKRQHLLRFYTIGSAFGMLLVALLGCYTPLQVDEARQRAIAQLDTAVQTLDYTPPSALLLAEERGSSDYSGIEQEYVGAELNRLYGTDWTCGEIVADYETAMLAAGWNRLTEADCDYPLWISFYRGTGEEFSIYARPIEGTDVEADQDITRQFQHTYFVSFRVIIPIGNEAPLFVSP